MEGSTVSTITCFGRNAKELETLEGFVAKADFSEHKALLVGAGIGPSELSEGGMSYEPFELAALLIRRRKPWSLTVMDYSERVCKVVSEQELVAVESPLSSDYKRGYVGRFAESFGRPGEKPADNIAEVAKSAFSPVRVTIPQEVRDLMSVVRWDVSKMYRFKGSGYNVAVLMNVLQHLNANEFLEAASALFLKMAPGALVLCDMQPPFFEMKQRINERTETSSLPAYVLRKPSTR